MSKIIYCPVCKTGNDSTSYYCKECGVLLNNQEQSIPELRKFQEMMKRIRKNLKNYPHRKLTFDEKIDSICLNLEKIRSVFNLPAFNDTNSELNNKISDLISFCKNRNFEIAFVGAVKAGKSTLINALLDYDYAPWKVTPETSVLSKFKYSSQNYVKVEFFTKNEWKELWQSRSNLDDKYTEEYNSLNANSLKENFLGKESITISLPNEKEAVREELSKWASSSEPAHFFVKQIEIGISQVPNNFPKNLTFVDTPGLLDPVAYRSNVTKEYIKKANCVFVCVNSKTLYSEEVSILASVFSFSGTNRDKVHVIGTQWDILNRPKEDWDVQKELFISKLTGKAYFPTKEMANENIMHSSANLYNSIRKVENGDLSLENWTKNILPAALKIFSGDKLAEVFNYNQPNAEAPFLFELKKDSNIEQILKKINEKIAAECNLIITKTIKDRLNNIKKELNRICIESISNSENSLKISTQSIFDLTKKQQDMLQKKGEAEDSRQLLDKYIQNIRKKTYRIISDLKEKCK